MLKITHEGLIQLQYSDSLVTFRSDSGAMIQLPHARLAPFQSLFSLHRRCYCSFPFSLLLRSLTYHTQQTNMAASRHAARPGDARSATLFLGDALPKYIRWAFPYPRPNIHMAGRTLPYPYLSASPDPLPRGSRGALVHPNGVYLHDPQSRVKTAQAKGVGGMVPP